MNPPLGHFFLLRCGTKSEHREAGTQDSPLYVLLNSTLSASSTTQSTGVRITWESCCKDFDKMEGLDRESPGAQDTRRWRKHGATNGVCKGRRPRRHGLDGAVGC